MNLDEIESTYSADEIKESIQKVQYLQEFATNKISFKNVEDKGEKVDPKLADETLMDSDPDIEFVEKDSGMSSLGGSKDETPERRTIKPIDENLRAGADCGADNCDDEPDESYAERLWGLTEMFPEPVRNFVGTVSEYSAYAAKNLYAFSCNASWIFFTSSMILFAPVIFETERAQMEEMQKTQQKQVLLGPGSAITGGSPMPPMTSRS